MSSSALYQDGKFYGLVFANISLEGFTRFMVKAGPILGVLLTLLQIVVAGITVWHFVRQQIRKHNEKNTPPPNSTGADI